MSITSPSAGLDPLVLFRNLDQLRDRMREWYAEWDAARQPLYAALLPLGERLIVSGCDALAPSLIPCWVAAGVALRAAGLGDFPAEVLNHRQLPPGILPPLRQLCEYAVWKLFTAATAACDDELQLETEQVRQYRQNYPASEWADEFEGKMLDACAGLLHEWERRNMMPFVERLKEEAERLGLTWQQVKDYRPFARTNGERLAFASWITSWHRGGAWVSLERVERNRKLRLPESPLAEQLPEAPAAPTPPAGVTTAPVNVKKPVSKPEAVERIQEYWAGLTNTAKKKATNRSIAGATGVSFGLVSEIMNQLGYKTEGMKAKKESTTGKPRTVPRGNDVLAVLPSGSMGDCTQEQIEAVRNAIEKHGLETLVEVVELYATQPDRDVKAPRS